MTTSKIVAALAVVMAASFSSFAGTPKSEAPAETTVKAKMAHTYYVISRNSSDNTYNLSLTPPARGCGVGSDPCEIVSDEDFTSTLKVDQDKVDTEDGVEIQERQTL